jgi:polysaccharide biosynthesis/export protein
LPIDYEEITMGTDSSTNYQLLPGDRLVVARNPSFKSEATEPVADRRDQEPPPGAGRSRYFDRTAKSTETHVGQLLKQREQPDDRAAVNRVEKRLKDVEEKLDLILEILKPRTPCRTRASLSTRIRSRPLSPSPRRSLH